MTTGNDPLLVAWWEKNIDQLDREIARLALLCEVKILDPGVIERVLHRDETVCGTPNPIAFAKLHDLLMLYFAIRRRSVEAVGALETAEIEKHVIEQLRSRFSEVIGAWQSPIQAG